MAIEFPQKQFSGYCKLEKKRRPFVTHCNNPDKAVCCFCSYGSDTKELEKGEEPITHYNYWAEKKEEEEE
ncbi:MAG TPA: hypothetical protein VMZ91_08700 [Candidatus Paceibacterota bacterium]|nr:hypothetical protein [Candidatus Paceibacterota bacterium]